jgi:uncharacterized protein YndB with AHSA1/START domain
MEFPQNIITVETLVNAPVEKVWQYWTEPAHIMQWNNASPDWHTTHATNNLYEGGSFVSRMEAKDGSMGFDFGGVYTNVQLHKVINYTMGDSRRVFVTFEPQGTATRIIETFEAETTHTLELQQAGWQAILNNFKQYVQTSVQ